MGYAESVKLKLISVIYKQPLSFVIFFSLSVLYASHSSANAEELSENRLRSQNIVELQPIIISVLRAQTYMKDAAENVIVYSAQDIKKTPAKDLGEVLSYLPGVNVQVGNKFGQSTSISIHGSDSRHVLVMVDGIPFNTQLSGQANPAKIPLENIKQIEVIKGASSSSWGSSLGGVINVITQDAGDSTIPHGSITSSFAEFETTKNSLNLSGKVLDLGYLLTASHLQTEGIQSKSDARETKTFSKIVHPLGDQAKLSGSFGYSGAKIHSGVTRNNQWNSTPYATRYGQIKLDIDQPDIQFSTAVKYNDQEITTDTYNALTNTRTSYTVSENVYHGLSLNSRHFFHEDQDALVLGADFNWDVFKSNNYLTEGKSINSQAPYFNYTAKRGSWDLIPGLRYDRNEQFGSQVSPSFGTVYHFQNLEETSLKAKVSRAFNAPPLLWIYNYDPSPGVLVGPNPDLKAERAWVYETGFNSKIFSPLRMELNLYRNDVKDAIATVSENGLFVKKNFRKFRRQGGELLLSYDVSSEWDVYASGAFNDVKNTQTKQIVRDQGIARQSFTLGTHYAAQNGFGFNLYGYYNRWSSSPSSQPNDRKFIFDTRLTKRFKNATRLGSVQIFLNIYNITNSKYWSSITFPSPRRYFEGGLSLEF